MFGIFDGIFDLEHDGKMNILEQAVEHEVFSNIVNASGKKTISIDQDFESEDKE